MKPIIPRIRRLDPTPAKGSRPAGSGHPSIELQIETLVFHGFSRGESHRASAAFQQELTRLLATENIGPFPDPATANRAHVNAGMVRAADDRPEVTGRLAAQALLGGLRQ